MMRHFGVLIPSTNTTVEIECRLLPATYQAHIGRLMSSGGGSFSPSRDEDIDHQSRLLGTAHVEMVILARTSASLFADDDDDVVTKRMSAGAGVPAITSAQALGRAVRALGARRIAIVSPYSEAVNARAAATSRRSTGYARSRWKAPATSIAAWEREFRKPVVTTNQASMWAMLRAFESADRLPAFGRLLAEVPADAS
jgi:maleate cis-trans isomerase